MGNILVVGLIKGLVLLVLLGVRELPENKWCKGVVTVLVFLAFWYVTTASGIVSGVIAYVVCIPLLSILKFVHPSKDESYFTKSEKVVFKGRYIVVCSLVLSVLFISIQVLQSCGGYINEELSKRLDLEYTQESSIYLTNGEYLVCKGICMLLPVECKFNISKCHDLNALTLNIENKRDGVDLVPYIETENPRGVSCQAPKLYYKWNKQVCEVQEEIINASSEVELESISSKVRELYLTKEEISKTSGSINLWFRIIAVVLVVSLLDIVYLLYYGILFLFYPAYKHVMRNN